MKTIKKLLLLFFSVAQLLIASALSAEKTSLEPGIIRSFKTDPITNHGKKWRIAYYEGGPYTDYQQVFTETIRGLMKLGWIEVAELPKQQGEENKTLWQWLVTKAKSDYLEFPKDMYYSSDWLSKQRTETIEHLIQRLAQVKDVDLLITMGTQAGQDLANNKHHTPTIILSSSDPIAGGVIKSVNDSGFEHVHATVDPRRYERQVRIFHEIFNFKKLGMTFEDSINGRSFSAFESVEKIARERGFQIIKCFCFDESVDDQRRREESVKKCFSELVGKVDAIYVTQQSGVNDATIPDLVRMANENHIPTFSQAGSAEVKYGLLLSLSQAGFKYVGDFHAGIIAKVLNGAKPNQLGQLFEEPPKIAINLKTAEMIGFDPPTVLLGAADEVFHEIVRPAAH